MIGPRPVTNWGEECYKCTPNGVTLGEVAEEIESFWESNPNNKRQSGYEPFAAEKVNKVIAWDWYGIHAFEVFTNKHRFKFDRFNGTEELPWMNC